MKKENLTTFFTTLLHEKACKKGRIRAYLRPQPSYPQFQARVRALNPTGPSLKSLDPLNDSHLSKFLQLGRHPAPIENGLHFRNRAKIEMKLEHRVRPQVQGFITRFPVMSELPTSRPTCNKIRLWKFRAKFGLQAPIRVKIEIGLQFRFLLKILKFVIKSTMTTGHQMGLPASDLSIQNRLRNAPWPSKGEELVKIRHHKAERRMAVLHFTGAHLAHETHVPRRSTPPYSDVNLLEGRTVLPLGNEGHRHRPVQSDEP